MSLLDFPALEVKGINFWPLCPMARQLQADLGLTPQRCSSNRKKNMLLKPAWVQDWVLSRTVRIAVDSDLRNVFRPDWVVPADSQFGAGIRWHLLALVGGGGGIRTPETLSGLTVFKTAGFNRSPTPPFLILAYSMS